MKAVRLHAYGGPEQLRYEDAPDPKPAPDEVLVKVTATSVNPIDYKLRSGAMKERVPLEFPAILGRDVSGEVVSAGAEVTTFKPGDKVIGLVNGAYAEYVTAKASVLTRLPEGLDPEYAAALPLVTLTGAQLIEKGVHPKPRQTILITGAAGNVGRSAVHVAKQYAAIVTAGVRSRQKQQASALHADAIVALDDDTELAALQQFDAIADTVDGEVIAKLIPKLNRTGVVASVLGVPPAAEKAGITATGVLAQPDPARLQRLAEDALRLEFKIPIAKKFKLSEAAEAHRLAEKGVEGKVLLVT